MSDGEGGPAESELSALLTDFEQSRIDVRQNRRQQGRIIMSGLAAIGLILVYSVVRSGDATFSPFLLGLVPIVIMITVLFLIEVEMNSMVIERHLMEISDEIKGMGGMELDNFGMKEKYGSVDGRERSTLQWWWFDFVDLPQQLLYLFVSFLLAAIVAEVFVIGNVVIGDRSLKLILLGSYTFGLLLIAVALVAYRETRAKLRRSDGTSSAHGAQSPSDDT